MIYLVITVDDNNIYVDLSSLDNMMILEERDKDNYSIKLSSSDMDIHIKDFHTKSDVTSFVEKFLKLYSYDRISDLSFHFITVDYINKCNIEQIYSDMLQKKCAPIVTLRN